MNWRFLNTGFNSGEWNMALDLRLAAEVHDANALPALRLYGWSPAALSLGANQRMEDFDAGALKAAGIDIVRRPTGGRAILHAQELTYCVVMKSDNKSPKDIYRFINEGIVCGLHLLGIDASMSERDEKFRDLYRETSAIPCFTSSAKCEIQYRGRKFVGSAQRRFGSTILQHGSLLLGPRHLDIVEYLSDEARSSKSAIAEELQSHAIDVETILGRPVTFDEAAVCIKQGLETGCGITFSQS